VTETISAGAEVDHTPAGGTDGSGVYTGVTLTDLGQALLDFVDDEDTDVTEDDIDELLSQY
jgi:hypothetical protein